MSTLRVDRIESLSGIPLFLSGLGRNVVQMISYTYNTKYISTAINPEFVYSGNIRMFHPLNRIIVIPFVSMATGGPDNNHSYVRVQSSDINFNMLDPKGPPAVNTSPGNWFGTTSSSNPKTTTEYPQEGHTKIGCYEITQAARNYPLSANPTIQFQVRVWGSSATSPTYINPFPINNSNGFDGSGLILVECFA